MDFAQLEYFVSVAKTQNMHASADALHISQPALSRSIKRLENELGVELFDRHNHSLDINSYGLLFLRYAESCLKDYKDGKNELHRAMDNAKNRIRIMCPLFYLTGIIFDAICGINPKISVEYHLFPYYEIENAIINRELDFCVTAHPIYNQQIDNTLITPLTMGVICAKGHPFENRDSIRVDELRNENHISFPEDKQPRNDLEILCSNKGFRPNVVFESDTFSALIQMCRKGRGVLMSSFKATKHMDMDGLTFIPFDNLDTNAHFNLYLLNRKNPVDLFLQYKEAILKSFTTDALDYKQNCRPSQ